MSFESEHALRSPDSCTYTFVTVCGVVVTTEIKMKSNQFTVTKTLVSLSSFSGYSG